MGCGGWGGVIQATYIGLPASGPAEGLSLMLLACVAHPDSLKRRRLQASWGSGLSATCAAQCFSAVPRAKLRCWLYVLGLMGSSAWGPKVTADGWPDLVHEPSAAIASRCACAPRPTPHPTPQIGKSCGGLRDAHSAPPPQEHTPTTSPEKSSKTPTKSVICALGVYACACNRAELSKP